VAATSVVAALLMGACSTTAPQCFVGADCASGKCGSDGQCTSASGQDGSVGPSGDGSTGSSSSGSAPGVDASQGDSTTSTPDASSGGGDSQAPPAGDSGICTPNNDGTIDRAEYVMLPGLHANYEFAENVTADTAGVTNSDGSRTWNLTGPYSGDHTDLVTTNAPTGQWFSADFAPATYTTTLSDTSNLLGIFQGTSSSLLLMGVASPTGSGSGSSAYTELKYAPPAEFISLPMQMGSTWSSTSQITGMAEGLVSNYTEQYSSKVDAHGSMTVPYGTFKSVLRVQTTLTRTMLGEKTVIQSFSWVAECFGPVASATSQPNETKTEFTNASEVERLTP
jgi:hypothetical protein